jgi:class 3 adenylate cyclase/alpha-beta hydrolase superfamily lysophospholipase
MMDDRPPIRYAKAGELSIAYRVWGEGPLDVVWVPGLASNLEIEWEIPDLTPYKRLASFSRLMVFDKRGMGLSDRNVGAPTLEDRIDDVRAVMDAVGSDRAALIGVSEGGPMSVLFAATYPERTVALVLFGTTARLRGDIDYPLGNEEAIAQLYRIIDEGWGTGESLRVFAPSLVDYEPLREFMGRLERASGSPGTIRAMVDTLVGIDVRAVLPTISVPTLVLHATDDVAVPIANGRWLADHIEGARFVELPGEHMAIGIDSRFGDEIETFLTGRQHAVATDRVLSTVLFSDIVGSTEEAAAVGDRRWREVLDRHDAVVAREINTYRGKLVKSTGDGVMATFDGPARAIACGRDIRDSLRPLGIDVRVGLHTGEIEVRGGDIGGIAVHISARVAAIADAGEVLVSRTVTDLVAGSGIEFVDRGDHELKGVPGAWRLFAVTA